MGMAGHLQGMSENLLGCRSFCGGSSFLCGSGLGLLGAAATGGFLGLFLGGSQGGLVEVHKLYQDHFCGVTAAETGVEDTEVSTGTVCHLRGDGAEKSLLWPRWW